MVLLPKCPDARPQQRANMWNCPQFPFFNVLRRCDQGLHCNPFFSEFPALDLGSHNFVSQKKCVIYGYTVRFLTFNRHQRRKNFKSKICCPDMGRTGPKVPHKTCGFPGYCILLPDHLPQLARLQNVHIRLIIPAAMSSPNPGTDW